MDRLPERYPRQAPTEASRRHLIDFSASGHKWYVTPTVDNLKNNIDLLAWQDAAVAYYFSVIILWAAVLREVTYGIIHIYYYFFLQKEFKKSP